MGTFRFRSHKKGSGSNGSSIGGKIFLIIFGLVWTTFSSLFVVFGIYLAFSDTDRVTWPTTPCEVQHFEVQTKLGLDPAFQPVIKYSYSWKSVEYTGTKIWQNKKGENEYRDLADLLDLTHDCKINECYVNPAKPSEAVIYPTSDSIWGGIGFAIFGGCFVLVGIGLVTMGIKYSYKKDKTLSSKKKEEEGAGLFLSSFLGIFGLAGLAVLIFFVIPMWTKYFEAQSWEPTTATVVWSKVSTHDSDTYSADIFYKYNHSGRLYKSNSVGLMGGSSSGRSGKQDKVNDHPRGKQITCFVNPDNPHDALLERDMGWWAAFSLFPLPFIAVGLVGLVGLIFDLKKKKNEPLSSATKPRSNHSGLAHEPSYRKEFKPLKKRIDWIFGSILTAAFWNGIISVFLFQVIEAWQKGDPDWFLTLFLIPFVFVGMGMILNIFYRLIACFNAAPILTISPAEITLSETTQLKWKTLSGEQKLKHFTIYLVGEEAAERERGKGTVTDISIFYEQALIDTKDPRKIRRGEAEISLPTDTMHTWESDSNAIQWSLRVRAKISFWPDIKDNYDVTVLPVKLQD